MINEVQFKKIIDNKDFTSYALFRKPLALLPNNMKRNKEQEVTSVSVIIDQHKTITQTTNLSTLLKKEGFVIAPFHVTEETPYLLIHPDLKGSLSFKYSQEIEHYRINYNEPSEKEEYEAYEQLFIKAKGELDNKNFQKIVIARKHSIQNVSEIIDPIKLFLKACLLYPHQFIALWHTPLSGTWLTATPELLYSKGKDKEKTMALAGTMPWNHLSSQKDLSGWSSKNKEEQQVVAQYIKNLLKQECSHFSESEIHPIKAGNLAHLCTDFSFNSSDEYHRVSLLNKLHPTPAICGLPKILTQEFLLHHESFDRQYYAGFSGYWEASDINDFFVSLRCMQINKDAIHLYAGGGILAESSLESEWLETKRKLQTMLQVIH